MKRYLFHHSRHLRNNPTEVEKLLWQHLRMKQMLGLKFRRQQPIDNYIVDFICFEKKLIIEVDGGQHSLQKDEDRERDMHLEKNGFKILRFWNNEVLENMEGVLEKIRSHCLCHPPLDPLPSREGI